VLDKKDSCIGIDLCFRANSGRFRGLLVHYSAT